jgi:GNAT superfamily N-acetyltransferase
VLEQDVSFRSLSRNDLQQVPLLFKRFRPAVAGVVSATVFSALCRDAVHATGCVIVLACQDESFFGIAISVVNWMTFWRRFLFRHPGAAIVVALPRVRRRVCRDKNRNSGLPMMKCGAPAPDVAELEQRWRQSAREIAKTVFIGVAPEARGRGVARRLYDYLFTVLRQEGVTRIDAQIDDGNPASVRLHQVSGWRVAFNGTNYYATKDISAR